MSKQKYRIRNWADYNKSLINRGSITFWINEESIKNWNSKGNNGKKGRPHTYSDLAIICALTIRALYNLPLRATEGFLISILQLLHLTLSTPNYSTLCRRSANLKVPLPRFLSKNKPIHVVIDSTGLKVYGEGEWKVRQHGYTKKRTWRKLHLVIDPDTHEIVAQSLTTNGIKDEIAVENLMTQIKEPILDVYADSQYDKRNAYRSIILRGGRPIIPPQVRARVQIKKNWTPEWVLRDKVVKEIEDLGGDAQAKKRWKIASNYHRRSLAETGMFRYKQAFGDRLRNRSVENQKTEVAIKCTILNKMTRLGMPKSEELTA